MHRGVCPPLEARDASGETLADRKASLIDNSPYRTAYKGKSTFDALNRPVEITLPADEDAGAGAEYGKTITPRFNRAGALQSVQMSGSDTPSVEHIAYNAKGQRILAALGNGVMTRYAYDPNVFRLSRMRSEKYAPSSTPLAGYTLPTDGTGKKYQDIVYAYDAVGNILSTDERISGIGVGGADTMLRHFAYDALYRLLSATGRESDIQKATPWQDSLAAKSAAGYNDSPQNTRPYTETYTYDELGGLAQLTHNYGPTSQWVRNYMTEVGSNRMTGLAVGANTYTYAYDSGGNLTQENTERHFEWDFAGHMRAFRNQVLGSAATIFAHYGYDGGGQRVQKVVTKGQKTTRTVYIDGIFEHQQVIENDAVTVENQTLHLMDDTRRVATYRAGPELDGVPRPATRYHLGDHLQSSSVVLGQVAVNGALFINREEYRPYGETAFGSFKYKRYRFTGKEKDEESGLHYHGARYYAPWAARWTAPDPMGMVDGPNLYGYVRGNPVRLVDPNGTEGKEKNASAPQTNDVSASGKHEQAGLASPYADSETGEINVPFETLNRWGAAPIFEEGKNDGKIVGWQYEESGSTHYFSGEGKLLLSRGSDGHVEPSLIQADDLLIGGAAVKATGKLASKLVFSRLGQEAAKEGGEQVAKKALTQLGKEGAEQTLKGMDSVLHSGPLLRKFLNGIGAKTTTTVSKTSAGKDRVLLGVYGGDGIIMKGGLEATGIPNAGLQVLNNLVKKFGGRTLENVPPRFELMAKEIKSADEIIFNIAESGLSKFSGKSLSFTYQELRLIISNPEILRKTTFIFGKNL